MKLLFAALLAAVVSFFWGFVSWMLLGWHEAGIRSFKDENAVAEVVKANATQGRGIYMLPGLPEKGMTTTPDEEARVQEAHVKAHSEGPYLYAIVRPGKQPWSMGRNLAFSFGRSLVAAVILGLLLARVVLPYIGRVAFCAAAGVFAGVAVDAQAWIWFELPTRELMVGLADHFIEWALAGLVLAAFLGKNPTARDELH